METQKPTDISIYDPSDREHVGWFYEPMGYQEGDWMKPYYHANIDTYMVSFVAPLIINQKVLESTSFLKKRSFFAREKL